ADCRSHALAFCCDGAPCYAKGEEEKAVADTQAQDGEHSCRACRDLVPRAAVSSWRIRLRKRRPGWPTRHIWQRALHAGRRQSAAGQRSPSAILAPLLQRRLRSLWRYLNPAHANLSGSTQRQLRKRCLCGPQASAGARCSRALHSKSARPSACCLSEAGVRRHAARMLCPRLNGCRSRRSPLVEIPMSIMQIVTGRAAVRSARPFRSFEARLGNVVFTLALIFAGAHGVLAHEFKFGDLEIGHPWSRATPHGAQVAGGYMTITNQGSSADRLVSVSSDISDKAEIHEMAVKDGVMTMRPVEGGLEIPA